MTRYCPNSLSPRETCDCYACRLLRPRPNVLAGFRTAFSSTARAVGTFFLGRSGPARTTLGEAVKA